MEYWISIAIIVALGLVLTEVASVRSTSGFAAVTLLVQIRRAHDFGRSGWWAVLGQLAPVALLFLLLLHAPLDVLTLVGELASLAVAIVFGVIPGDRGDNRFGPPPPKRLAGMFERR